MLHEQKHGTTMVLFVSWDFQWKDKKKLQDTDSVLPANICCVILVKNLGPWYIGQCLLPTQTHEEWAQSDAVDHVRSSPSPFSPQQEVCWIHREKDGGAARWRKKNSWK